MNKKTGILFVAVGAVLLLAALLFWIFCENEDNAAGESAAAILAGLREQMDDPDTDGPQSADGESSAAVSDGTETHGVHEIPLVTAPKVITVEGYDCIGYIDMPTVGITLPVLADWDDERLDTAPCRHFGSAEDDDLVIAGHNFKRHFGYLSDLERGDRVSFFDVYGTEHAYTVTGVAHIMDDDVTAVQNSGHDLVLYTCTFVGDVRVAVFCDRGNESQ